jgi:hypothetical protein
MMHTKLTITHDHVHAGDPRKQLHDFVKALRP